jgi:Xaa-Pro aminopeptidase
MPKSLVFTQEEYLHRAQDAQDALEREGLDALIGYSVKNAPGPVAYLGGYEPCLGLHDVAFFVLIPGGHPKCTLLTNAFWDNPQERTWVDEVIITSDFGARLVELLPGSARRIGVAGYKFFPAPVYTAIRAALPDAHIEDASHMLMKVARVKSSAEIEIVRRCVAITDAGGRTFLNSVREGANEREIQAALEQAMIMAGADALAYNSQVYSGPQVAVGIGFRMNRTLARGEQVQVDCGALYGGYRGDFSRVTTVGPPSAQVQAIMEATARMYEAMLAAIRPGVPVADVAGAALATAKAEGMDAYLYHSPNHASSFFGHGIGCWYHQSPEIHLGAQDVLEANMLLVPEPILGCPGVGGAKIEDIVLVTPQGAERLSSLEIRTWLS